METIFKARKTLCFWIDKQKIPYFGLPGNPVSAVITFIQLVWPALQKLEGITNIEFPLRIKVKLNSDLKRRKGRPELLRGKLIVNEEGELIADISEEQSSSKISSISNSDLLIEIPSEIDFCQKGNLLWAQLLKIIFYNSKPKSVFFFTHEDPVKVHSFFQKGTLYFVNSSISWRYLFAMPL